MLEGLLPNISALSLDVGGVADGQVLYDYPAHNYNVFTEPGACDYHSTPYTWTNSNADSGFTLNLDQPYSSYSAINVADGQSLGRGPEFYNNMAAPNNCVGGSETSCPATNPTPVAPPAHWYANGSNISVADGQQLGRGPEFYNNMAAPNNCVGGSETSCPATDPVPVAPPAHWYANGNVTIADGQQLRGAEFYNCDTCSKNCVGGSEGSCIPKNAPVGNPDLMGGEPNGFVYANNSNFSVADGQQLGRGPEFYNNMGAPNNCVGGSETSCPASGSVPPPAPAHWYANGSNFSIADGQQLGRGPEFYNCQSCPNNCVGGSETSCPATDPQPPPPPAHWYANGNNVSIADGQQLRGAEFYNNQTAPGNCVGGSEQGCSPSPAIPVARGPDFYNCDYNSGCANGNNVSIADGQQLRGAEFYNNQTAPGNCVGGSEQGCSPPGMPVSRGAEFYNCDYNSGCANGTVGEMGAAKELAMPALAATEAQKEPKTHKANPGHLLLSCHAFTLAALESVLHADFNKFDEKVAANAEAVTPVGAAVLRQHVFAK